MSQFFKCLSDETRLQIVLLIVAQGELCVCELMAALDDSQPKISRHLAQLRNCGVLSDERRGQWVYYSINNTLPDWAHQVLHTVLHPKQQLIAELQAKLVSKACY